MADEIDWKLVESTGYGIVIIKSELPYFCDAILNNSPINSDEIIQKFKKNGICDQFGYLTERGRVVALSYLSLEEQCKILGIKLYYNSINITKGTEVSALEFFKDQGYIGYFSEGDLIQILLYCIFYDQLIEILKEKDEDLDESYLSFEYFPKIRRFELIDLIKNTNSKCIKKNFKKISKNYFLFTNDYTREHLDGNSLVKIYNGLGNDELAKIAKIYFDDESLYGWPDLILLKDNKVKFIEVKKEDKLRRSQIITLDTLTKSTNLDISVLKII